MIQRRSKPLLVLGMTIVAALRLLSAGPDAQWAQSPAWTTFAPMNDVSFAVSTERQSYAIHDAITAQYRIVNVSSRSVYVPRHLLEGCPTVVPHVSIWLENDRGQHSSFGYAASCAGTMGAHESVGERMSREAILLAPGEHYEGPAPVFVPPDATPGAYRIEATVYGWNPDNLSEADRVELGRMVHPFLRGEAPVSIAVELR